MFTYGFTFFHNLWIPGENEQFIFKLFFLDHPRTQPTPRVQQYRYLAESPEGGDQGLEQPHYDNKQLEVEPRIVPDSTTSKAN